MYEKSLFIFRRDLRLEDNTGLIEALKQSKEVIACFIFDPRQTKSNEYFSPFCFQFLIDSLNDLNKQLEKRGSHLYLFEGLPHEVAANLEVDTVFVNRDYTPFSKKRDILIAKECEKKGIDFFQYNDLLLNEPEAIKKGDDSPYSIFTPFMKFCRRKEVRYPQSNTYKNFASGKLNQEKLSLLKELDKGLIVNGGRKKALEIIKNLDKFHNYENERDIPRLDATSHLSAHHKFGTVSIRESYYAIQEQLGELSLLINEIYWRDFFTHIGFHFPHVFESAFNKKYKDITWENNQMYFRAWQEGKTGFPIVDAGMREMNETGFMHNRVRMIVASFLTKDLLVDWRWGEKYFAQKLVDYDPCVNNGNWQWAASTGCDAQPYFRIFNPWLQQQRFDPQCEYIKKWVPELAKLDAKEIHAIEKFGLEDTEYPAPIVDHKVQKEKALGLFKS